MRYSAVLGEIKDRAGRSYADAADELLQVVGAASVLVGTVAAGAPAVAALAAVLAYEKPIKLGAKILDKLSKARPRDYAGRVEKLRDTYCLLQVSAFFDALDELLPEEMRRELSLSAKEKEKLTILALRPEEAGEFALPDPLFGVTETEEALRKLYGCMTENLRRFVSGLAFFDLASELEYSTFQHCVEELPGKAIAFFRDSLNAARGKSAELDVYIRDGRERRWEEYAAAGLAELRTLISDAAQNRTLDEMRQVALTLAETYRRALSCTLTRDAEEDETLRFPTVEEAFIPQRFKLLCASGKKSLENPETWEKTETRNNLTQFWEDYFADCGSTERLLLILGEPGGGKSTLTEVLCARLSSEKRVLLRVPLRECSMDQEIETLLLRQLKRDGDPIGGIPTFRQFAEAFPDEPITLVFDGYDEIMQATGCVFRSFLKKLKEFQTECEKRKRPVRVIVTSRVTMIDKAEIPADTGVILLEEFDDEQRSRWISIWNRENHAALQTAGLEDFALPEGNRDVDELSRQPLLLLMLAMYDADFENGRNALRCGSEEGTGLSRTRLYDRLLRRFIRRELRKGARGSELPYEELEEAERRELEDREMFALGVAALGMFARARQHLYADELDSDLRTMGMETACRAPAGKKAARRAELIFGRFFFIHHARANQGGKEAGSYEFLHKTFYEFLLADLMLGLLIAEADKAAGDPTALSPRFYAALGSALLPGEPEAVSMLGEWIGESIPADTQAGARRRAALCEAVEGIFRSHAALLLAGSFVFPPESALLPESTPSRRGAACLMNLLILCTLLRGELRFAPEDWRGLSRYLWLNATQRSGDESAASDPAEENLLDLMALFHVSPAEDGVILRPNGGVFIRRKNPSLCERRETLFSFLLDEPSRLLYQINDKVADEQGRQRCRRALNDAGIDLEAQIVLTDLELIQLRGEKPSGEKLVHAIDKLFPRDGQPDPLLRNRSCRCLLRILGALPGAELAYVRQKASPRLMLAALQSFSAPLRERETAEIIWQLVRTLGVELPTGLFFADRVKDLPDDQKVRFWLRALEKCPRWLTALSPEERNMLLEQLAAELTEASRADTPPDRKRTERIEKLLLLFFQKGMIPPEHPIWEKMDGCAFRLFRRAPEAALPLLRVCLPVGRRESLAEILRSLTAQSRRSLLSLQPETLADYLRLGDAAAVPELFEGVLKSNLRFYINKFESIEPTRLLPLLPFLARTNLLESNGYSGGLPGRCVEFILTYDTAEAIEQMFALWNTESAILRYLAQLIRSMAGAAALRLSTEPVNTALKLLILYYHLEGSQRCENVLPLLVISLDRALAYRDETDPALLAQLLDCLDGETLAALRPELDVRRQALRLCYPLLRLPGSGEDEQQP